MNIHESILSTIQYAAYYENSLTAEELEQRLISTKIFTTQEIETEIRKYPEISNKLVSSTKIKWRKVKLEKAKKLAEKLFRMFPMILFIGVTGSVAAGYPKENDDIDILIITKTNCLWITRFFIRLYILFKNVPHRKYGQNEEKDQFCFNLWLDSKSLKLSKNRQTLNNAIDLILMRPLLDRNDTYTQFINANDWASRYTATGYDKIWNGTDKFPKQINNKVMAFINILFYIPQYIFMLPKLNGESIGLHYAFFHPKLTARFIQ